MTSNPTQYADASHFVVASPRGPIGVIAVQEGPTNDDTDAPTVTLFSPNEARALAIQLIEVAREWETSSSGRGRKEGRK